MAQIWPKSVVVFWGVPLENQSASMMWNCCKFYKCWANAPSSCCISYALSTWPTVLQQTWSLLGPTPCLPASQPACLLVYLTLIANAHRDLANDELGWGKITRCFPRHRYSCTCVPCAIDTRNCRLFASLRLPSQLWTLSSLKPCNQCGSHVPPNPKNTAVVHCVWYWICLKYLN